MCLAVPVKIKKINGLEAEVLRDNKTQKIDITMMPELKKGDWVLTNGILAVKKINAKEAEEFFNLIK
jgi:hydrogenase assembly chaperone HypC/HupF